MSDIWISINHLAETTQTTAPHAHGRKNKGLKKKRKKFQSERKSSMEGKYKSNSRMRTNRQRHAQRWNGASAEKSSFSASTNNNSLRHSGSTARTSEHSCSPSTSAPNDSSTASAQDCRAKPSTSTPRHDAVPPPSSAATSDCRPSGSKPGNDFLLPPSRTVSSFPHCGSTPSVSTHSQPSLSVTVKSSSLHDKPKKPWSSAPAAFTSASSASNSCKQPTAKTAAAGIPTKYLAVDCEMVGAGPKGSISQLARCSVVNFEGDVVYDKFIKPSMPVTDYRTRWSGIRHSDLANATPYAVARKEILKLLNGKVVIGHAVHNDFKVLGYSHPAAMTRDTSRIPLLNQKAGFAENQSASLKRLTKAIFNRDIQTGKRGHSSVEDARATMELYKVVEEEWERTLASRSQASQCQV